MTTVECPMRSRIPTNEEVWLDHKLKTEVDVDSLLQETLPPGPVEDGVYALPLAFLEVATCINNP